MGKINLGQLKIRPWANFKSLYPRSSQSSILKTQNCDQVKHDYKPGSNSLEYHLSYTTHLNLNLN